MATSDPISTSTPSDSREEAKPAGSSDLKRLLDGGAPSTPEAIGHRNIVEPEFDRDFYLKSYPDVAKAKVDPLDHFMTHGWKEKRDPSAAFSTAIYLELNPDVEAAEINPFLHYLAYGREEKRPATREEAELARKAEEQARKAAAASLDPEAARLRALVEPEFDAAFYLEHYPDIARAEVDPLDHFLTLGWKEKRDPSAAFSTALYLELNPDVAAVEINPFVHYLEHGRDEKRPTTREEAELARKAQAAATVSPADLAAARDRALVEPEFDAAFYLERNPDVTQAGLDPLDHFMAHGWQEKRDPCAAFSIKDYLEYNPDVAALGNPFVHFLRYGRLEGRWFRKPGTYTPGARSLASMVTLPPAKAVHVGASETYGVVSLIKNEGDIIEQFAAHLLQLFDSIVFIDHGSTDGTYEFLKALEERRREVVVYRLDEPGYIQAVTMNHMVRTAKELQGVDWLFLLDADEFLPFSRREEFAAALRFHADAPVLAMRWKNLIPNAYWDYKVDIRTSFYVPTNLSDYQKIALQPKKLRDTPFWIEQGNHTVSNFRGGTALPAPIAFPLYHIPVRSKNQLSLKLSQGVAGYLRLGAAKKDLEGTHWFQILEQLKHGEITEGLLDKIVMTYGVAGADFTPAPRGVLIESGRYELVELDLAKAEIEETIAVPENVAELIFKINGQLAAKADSSIEGRPITRLSTSADRVLRRAAEDQGFLYPSLPPIPADDAFHDLGPADDVVFIRDFLRPTYWPIADLTPTSWGGHIPFMHALVSEFRPRVFAELGSHWGASFFAYCHAAQRTYLDTTAVAIDSWEGDPQAGFYDDRVFDNFKTILKKYAGFAHYQRMRFDKALSLFAEGSIDLLHIDGLHTYEAVKNDFDTWLPKMSERGIIVFHDINVHERDFGVWQLWEDVRRRYPTMEFRHTHGLGIAYVGTVENTRIERLMRLLSRDGAWGSMVQHHLERVSETLIDLVLKTNQIASTAEKVKALGQLNEEVSRLRQSHAAVATERNELRRLLNEARSGPEAGDA